MNTYTIEITNNKAYHLLKNMEDLNVIKILKRDRPEKDYNVAPSSTAAFRGTLKLSKSRFENFQKHVQQIRNEWPENI